MACIIYIQGGEDTQMPHIIGHFRQKSPIRNGSSAERDLQSIIYPMHLRHSVHMSADEHTDRVPFHFPQKSPIRNGSFVERDLQRKAFYASLLTRIHHTYICRYVCCSALQCVAVCICIYANTCVALWCSVVQCGAVCCSVYLHICRYVRRIYLP